MIIHPSEQGSAAWAEARLGIPTASEFSRIITTGGKLSKSRDGYMAELVGEWATGESGSDWMGNDWTERGHILEGEARAAYGLLRDADVTECGLCYRDASKLVAASPDGFVGDGGLIELKVPKAGTHLLWLARGEVPRDYIMQLQGQLWVTSAAWVDFYSYHPGLPPFIVRSQPDYKIHDAFDQHIPTFISELLASRERLIKLGVQPVKPWDAWEPEVA